MPWLGRADEVVESDTQPAPDGPEFPVHVVAVRQRFQALFARAAKDVLRMLVVAHDEAHVEAGQPLVAGNDVGRDLFVRRAEMRPVVDVVDCSCEIEARHERVRRRTGNSSFYRARPAPWSRSNQARSASAWTSFTGRPVACAMRRQSSNSGWTFRTSPPRPATLTRTSP